MRGFLHEHATVTGGEQDHENSGGDMRTREHGRLPRGHAEISVFLSVQTEMRGRTRQAAGLRKSHASGNSYARSLQIAFAGNDLGATGDADRRLGGQRPRPVLYRRKTRTTRLGDITELLR